MDETIMVPSPNWFLPSIMAVSPDSWLIYGGPNKTLSILEPLKPDAGIIATKEKYQAHVYFCGNSEKVIAVDISPKWSEKKLFLTGSLDGSVKQYMLGTCNNRVAIKETHCHEAHKTANEELVGVGYSNETVAVSVGAINIAKWDLTSNITKVYSYFLRGVKPTCMACSQHTSLQVAVGTKQGVILLLDLHGKGKILYKVRGPDDIVMNLSFCPQYEMTIKKSGKENKSMLDKRLAAIRSEGEKETNTLDQSGIGKNLPEDSFDESIVQEDDMFDIYKDHESDEFGHKKYEPEDILVKVKKEKADPTDYLADCLKLKDEILRRKNQTEPTIDSLVDALDKTHVEVGADDQSAQTHVESAQHDVESSQHDIESALSAPESAQSRPESALATTSTVQSVKIDTTSCDKSSYKLLLVTCGKFGGIRIWSGTGKLVASCSIALPPKCQKIPFVTSVLWYKPDSIIVCDGRNQIVEINPQKVDSRNRLEWQVLHHKHKRGLYCVKTNAPRVQTESTEPSNDWSLWSVAQDRNIIRYCVRTKKVLSVHASCGGSVYSVVSCPYDAGKVAISVGDGAIRVIESGTLAEDDTRLMQPRVTTYWQNVQGKVLTVAWHPTKENLLAYGTGEARVGLIDTGNKYEQPARVLRPALSQGVYSLAWGEDMLLYASGGSKLLMYHANHINDEPTQLDVTVEGQLWAICTVTWSSRGLLVGSVHGAVALLTERPPHMLIAAAFVYGKMVHAIEWHPQQTSSSSEESKYKNLIAVSGVDKNSIICILEYGNNEEDGSPQLTIWKTLSGHTKSALHLAWNPHRDGLLLSSSQDATVRVWDVATGTCIAMFGGHAFVSLGVCWVNQPQLPHHVLSGGGEFCLRLWDINKHKPENFTDTVYKVAKKRSRKRELKKEVIDLAPDASSSGEEHENIAITVDISNKTSKAPRKFLLPIMFKQINDPCKLHAPKKMLEMFIQKTDTSAEKGDGTHNVTADKPDSIVDNKGDSQNVLEQDGTTKVDEEDDKNKEEIEFIKVAIKEKAKKKKGVNEIDLDFLKVFGSIKEVNEFLDFEMDSHLHYVYSPEACIMLLIFRGHIDTMIQFASERDMLCPFLLSMAPCVSFKYWKDATQLYLTQIDRLVARGEEFKLYENRQYGGPKYRKAAILLSMHDVVGAVAALSEGKLFKEAYILCRLRYMDSVAEDVMVKWAAHVKASGQVAVAALLLITMGNLSEAAQVLAMSQDQDCLSLAADIAKVAGRTTFADQVQKKANHVKSLASPEKTEEILKELPSKIELLMKESKGQASNNLESDTLNGTLKSDQLNGDSITNE